MIQNKNIIIIIVFLICIGVPGYSIYEKYSPLAELADCGQNCIDYKKIQVTGYETPLPDIRITGADEEKMLMDIPIIIHNPSKKDTETLKIDFDVYMEGRHLTKGMIPARELPSRANTTIIMEDVELKYEELAEVLQILAARHGTEMVIEGKANISMTSDLLIYLPIEIFGMKIYTFTIPITIETDIPVDLLKQKEETRQQIEDVIIESVTGSDEVINETPFISPTEKIPIEPGIPASLPTLP